MADPTLLKKIAKFDSHSRFLISLGVALVVFVIAGQSPVPMVRVIWAWLGGAGSMLLLSFHSMKHAEVHHIKMIAAKQDLGKHVIFALVLIGSCCSLLAIGDLVVGTKGLPREDIAFHLALAGFTILVSWLLIHTIYAFRYAHLFYSRQGGGLAFPETEEPDYIDFAYFSFVVGMTCQVSDVTISSRRIRRVVLMHGILSFIFNTIILAMSINLLAGML